VPFSWTFVTFAWFPRVGFFGSCGLFYLPNILLIIKAIPLCKCTIQILCFLFVIITCWKIITFVILLSQRFSEMYRVVWWRVRMTTVFRHVVAVMGVTLPASRLHWLVLVLTTYQIVHWSLCCKIDFFVFSCMASDVCCLLCSSATGQTNIVIFWMADFCRVIAQLHVCLWKFFALGIQQHLSSEGEFHNKEIRFYLSFCSVGLLF